jgi:hypothetical protein
MKRVLGLLFAMIWGLATVCSAQTVTLFGSEVTAVGYYPTLQQPFTFPATATVGSGVEFPAGSILSLGQIPITSFNADIRASSINVQYLLNQQAAVGTFNGLVLTFDSSSPVITGVSLDPSSTITPVGLSFGPHDVEYNGSGLTLTPDSHFTIDLSLAASPVVPEPSTLWLAAAAVPFVGLMVLRRRRRA